MKVDPIYFRVSSDDQDLARQADRRRPALLIGGVYREKASFPRADRPEQRMIADLRPGDVVIAENIDRISRLPLDDLSELEGQEA